MATVLEDPSQEEIISLIRKGQNIFITGPGGTGKSTLVRRIADEIINVGITAMTGCAALLLDCKAKTLHSWTGIGLGRDPVAKAVETICKRRYVKKRWVQARTLVIDEVSMLTPDLFEYIDKVGRLLRKCPLKPFGGLQLILVGDFCQLPPVNKDLSGEISYLFESELWSCVTQYVVLNKIWRQTDPVYQKVLSEVRLGYLSPESEAILRDRMNRDWRSEPIRPTLLFSRNFDVDKVNDSNLESIENTKEVFKAKTVFDLTRWSSLDVDGVPPDADSEQVKWALAKLEQDATYVNTLELKVDAQVMLITNYDTDTGLVNGSRGVITGFAANGFPIVKFKNKVGVIVEPFTWWSHEMPHVGKLQIPLRVAYAITIHKSQGASIDSAIVDIGKNTFEYGQAYVALSRVRSLEGLYLHALDVGRIRTCPRVLEFYRGIKPIEATVENSLVVTVEKSLVVTVVTGDAWSLDCVDKSWLNVLEKVLALNPNLETKIKDARNNSTVFPAKDSVFAALSMPIDSVKVVILGQDPYHGAGQAIGFSFAVPDNVAAPPSLKNIMKEIQSDIGKSCSSLLHWPKQGVLLLNTLLTVEQGKPLSHENIGWENVTDALITEIARVNPGTVWMLWGKNAQRAKKLLNGSKYVLESVHPSPLSAFRGYFGCKHFSKTNELLKQAGKDPIQWTDI